MGAYAALLSLSHTLDQIFILDQYPLSIQKHKLVSLQEKVTTLMAFLEHYSSNCRGVVNPLESRIIKAAYKAEDIVETQLSNPLSSAFKNTMLSCLSLCCNDDLSKVLQEIDSILKDGKNDQPENITMFDVSDSASLSAPVPSVVSSTVGLDGNFMSIKDLMCRNQSTFQVIPIFGIGGIGKTTLATRLYEDFMKRQRFDRCIWIVVSQDYSPRKIILGILQSLEMPTGENWTDGELATKVHKELFGKRYLIVADDVWSKEAWDVLNSLLPRNIKGSQVLVTTRLESVATYASSSSLRVEIQFLSEEQGWRLLVDRVFGKQSCPSQLEHIGRKIAKFCRGLPLMIVVIAGLLKEDITEAYWKRTLNMISSSVRSDMLEHCSKVLSLSYDHLPLYLKPCFLYVTAFPEDYEVEVDRLVRLWMAEGFVIAEESECLEEVAEGYVNDLVGRRLVIGSKERYGDKVRAVKVHDTLREMGIVKAREGRFFHDGDSWRLARRVNDHNRDAHQIIWPLSNFWYNYSKLQDTTIRTYLNTGNPRCLSDSFESNRLLRVLYSVDDVVEFDLVGLVLLRYVSINNASFPFMLLPYLQTLEANYVDPSSTRCLRLKIWKMPFLRHVKVDSGVYLCYPSGSDDVKETDLQTLSVAENLKLTPQVVKMLANLRKLHLNYIRAGLWQESSLNNLVHLQKLEELRITDHAGLDWESMWSSKWNLPISLKKLELISVRISWEYINRVVGLLTNLEVLKVGSWSSKNSVTNTKWHPIEGRFLKLKHLGMKKLKLKHWVAERFHFPSLEILVIEEIEGLMDLPSGIGEIDGLKLIQLDDCPKSLRRSAQKLQAEQQEMGNDQLQVIITNKCLDEIRNLIRDVWEERSRSHDSKVVTI